MVVVKSCSPPSFSCIFIRSSSSVSLFMASLPQLFHHHSYSTQISHGTPNMVFGRSLNYQMGVFGYFKILPYVFLGVFHIFHYGTTKYIIKLLYSHPQIDGKVSDPGIFRRELLFHLFGDDYLGVSLNRGTPKSSAILVGFSLINQPFWGYPHDCGNRHIFHGGQRCVSERHRDDETTAASPASSRRRRRRTPWSPPGARSPRRRRSRPFWRGKSLWKWWGCGNDCITIVIPK